MSRMGEKQRKLKRLVTTANIVKRRKKIMRIVWNAPDAYKDGELRKKNLTCSRARCMHCHKNNDYGRKGLSKRERVLSLHYGC